MNPPENRTIMNAKTTIALILIAVALGAWLYVAEMNPDTTPAPDGGGEEVGQRLYPEDRLDPAKTASLSIKLADRPAAVFSRDADHADTWRQTDPIVFDANAWGVQRLITTAGQLRATSTFKPAAKDLTLGDLGLAPPRAVLTVTSDGGMAWCF